MERFPSICFCFTSRNRYQHDKHHPFQRKGDDPNDLRIIKWTCSSSIKTLFISHIFLFYLFHPFLGRWGGGGGGAQTDLFSCFVNIKKKFSTNLYEQRYRDSSSLKNLWNMHVRHFMRIHLFVNFKIAHRVNCNFDWSLFCINNILNWFCFSKQDIPG